MARYPKNMYRTWQYKVFTLCLIVGVMWALGMYLLGQDKLILWGMVPVALGTPLGFLAIWVTDRAQRKYFRDIDNGLEPDETGRIYNSRARTIQDSIKYGVKPPKGF